MRFRVFQQDFTDEHPSGVDVCVYETDDATTANREAQELSVPGNTCWVVDTDPKWSPRLPLSGYGRRY